MTQQQPQQSSHTIELPRTADVYRCQQCGMEVEIKQDCRCQHGSPRLECCGQPLTKS